MADILTASPMDAQPGLYTQGGDTSAGVQPGAMPPPVPNPALPADFVLPHNVNFDRDLQQARAGGAPPAATPAPPAPAKAATPAPATPDDGHTWKPKDKRKAQNWDDLKDDFAKREAGHIADKAALKAEVEALRTGKPVPASGDLDITKLDYERVSKHPEVAKRLKERDDYFDIVKQVAVERDPEFVARFEPRREAAIRAAKAVAGGASADLAKLLEQAASELRDERISKLTENFSEGSKRTVGAALQTLASIDIEREGEIASRKASFETRQLDQFKQQEARVRDRQATLDKAFDHQLALWADPKEGMPFYVKTGDVQQDAAVDATVATARQIFSGTLTPEQLADYAKWAAVAKRVFSEREMLLTELARFRDADQRWRAGSPSDAGGHGSLVETARQSAQPAFNPADPFSGSRSFAEGLEAARNS